MPTKHNIMFRLVGEDKMKICENNIGKKTEVAGKSRKYEWKFSVMKFVKKMIRMDNEALVHHSNLTRH